MGYFNYNGKKVYYSESGKGTPLVLLHGNTACSKMFDSIVSSFVTEYRVITIDFLGCGQSERIEKWPADLWFDWGQQVRELCDHLKIQQCYVIGTSGGALAALNFALENPRYVKALICDSFEGVCSDSGTTEQIANRRNYAKQMDGFHSTMKMMHGDNWGDVLDSDTNAIIRHSIEVGEFFHHPISELQVPILLTGSEEDEMFPKNHYEVLFSDITDAVKRSQSYIFKHGSHPAMISNEKEFLKIAKGFLSMNL